MTAVLRMSHEEPVRLDRDQLELLYVQLGTSGADHLVTHALEELAVSLARVRKQYRRGRIDELRVSMRTLKALARQVGMTLLARVAQDVLDLTERDDAAALGATIARLARIGENSLIAIWDSAEQPA